jgi:Hemerythrin HHE cation binding domain
MTVLHPTTTPPVRFRTVALDLYRGVHKGIRSELFAVTGDAGRLDPTDECGIATLTEQVRSVAHLLGHHAETEDRHIGPVLETFVPELADRIGTDHQTFERRFTALTTLAEDVRTSTDPHGPALHELYIELAAFTSCYLAHQDVEEREINPALEDAIGFEGMLSIHTGIISNMAPRELIGALAVMLPAMNIDDRAGMLGGMQAGAPPQAFKNVWSLTRSVLSADDFQAVARRLGLG